MSDRQLALWRQVASVTKVPFPKRIKFFDKPTKQRIATTKLSKTKKTVYFGQISMTLGWGDPLINRVFVLHTRLPIHTTSQAIVICLSCLFQCLSRSWKGFRGQLRLGKIPKVTRWYKFRNTSKQTPSKLSFHNKFTNLASTWLFYTVITYNGIIQYIIVL